MTVVDDVKSRLDIVEVVSARVPLQRSGRSFKANCPFHQENTPSFHVFPDRQSWRCFGACATGGDALSFVMRAENLEFGEALRQLAQQTGVSLPQWGQRPRDEATHKVNEDARAFFQRTLASAQGASAREYLEQRGLNRQAIDAFEVGLSPSDGESLKNHLAREGYSPDQLASAGVVRTGDDGLHHDLFRGRLMFPIRDAHGHLVGFGARSLDGSEPKYLNSPQGPLFDKSRLLYALDRARTEVRKEGAVIVEGYMDAIAAHQAGFKNVVAQMGTALTEYQVDELRRLTGKITMALDQDAAGQAATLRSLDVIFESFRTKAVNHRGPDGSPQGADPDPRIIVMPPGQDPDEVIHRSPGDWTRLVESAMPAITFRINAATDRGDTNTPEGKAQIVAEAAPHIHLLGEGFQQANAVEYLAQRLGASIDTVKAALSRPSVARRARRPEQRPAATSPFAKLDHDPMEEYCLQLLLGHPELREPADQLRAEFFRRHENREVFNRWLDANPGLDKDETVATVRRGGNDEVAGHLEALLAKPEIPLDINGRASAFLEVASRLEERNLRDLKSDEVIRFAESPPDLDGEHDDILRLNQQIKHNEGLRKGQTQEIFR